MTGNPASTRLPSSSADAVCAATDAGAGARHAAVARRRDGARRSCAQREALGSAPRCRATRHRFCATSRRARNQAPRQTTATDTATSAAHAPARRGARHAGGSVRRRVSRPDRVAAGVALAAAGRLRELEKALAELRTEGEVPQEVIDLAASAHERLHVEVQALRELGAAAALGEALLAEIDEALRAASSGAGPQPDFAAFRERLAGLSAGRPAWLAGHPTAAALASALERAREKLDEIAPPAALPATPVPKKERRKEKKTAAPPWDEIRGLARQARGAPRRWAADRGAGDRKADRWPRRLGAAARRSRPSAQASPRAACAHARLGEVGRRPSPVSNSSRLPRLSLPGQDKERERPDIEALAASVRTLREEWKKRDATRPASKVQWARFDAILTRAFKPVLEIRAKRAIEAKAAAQARAALCDELDAWLASPESAAAPFKEIEAKRSDFRRRLGTLPGPQTERALRKRLDKIFKALDTRLDAARGAEIRRREELIAKAQALKDAPVGDAIKSAIALQKTWQESAGVHLGRKDEQALWSRFHAATNAVFARRDDQRAKQNEQRAKQRSALSGMRSASRETTSAKPSATRARKSTRLTAGASSALPPARR